jgi:hypothetical protein
MSEREVIWLRGASHVLGVGEIDKAPVKIDHALVAGGLIRFITGEAEQLVAQGREGISFPYPDDYVELVDVHGACSEKNGAGTK